MQFQHLLDRNRLADKLFAEVGGEQPLATRYPPRARPGVACIR